MPRAQERLLGAVMSLHQRKQERRLNAEHTLFQSCLNDQAYLPNA